MEVFNSELYHDIGLGDVPGGAEYICEEGGEEGEKGV